MDFVFCVWKKSRILFTELSVLSFSTFSGLFLFFFPPSFPTFSTFSTFSTFFTPGDLAGDPRLAGAGDPAVQLSCHTGPAHISDATMSDTEDPMLSHDAFAGPAASHRTSYPPTLSVREIVGGYDVRCDAAGPANASWESVGFSVSEILVSEISAGSVQATS